MIASRTQGNAQHDERISLQHFALKNGVARLQCERKAYQFDPPSCNDDLAYAVCQRARWRCEMCQMAHGSHVMCDYGFSRVVLNVDCQARRPRALCQRCRLAATDEMPLVLVYKKPVIGKVKLVPLDKWYAKAYNVYHETGKEKPCYQGHARSS